MVTSGVRATLWDDQNDRDLPDRLVRNLSGALVLLNRPLGETYTFRISPALKDPDPNTKLGFMRSITVDGKEFNQTVHVENDPNLPAGVAGSEEFEEVKLGEEDDDAEDAERMLKELMKLLGRVRDD